MTSKEELACVYAALILQDDEVAITGEKIETILKAAGVEVEPFWPSLFAKALEGVDVKALITNITNNMGAAPSAPPAPSPTPAVEDTGKSADNKTDKKKKEEPEQKEEEGEEEGDMFALFG